MDIKKELIKQRRNSVRLTIEGEADQRTGSTKFGGKPDVPGDFRWPYFEGEGYPDDRPKLRPLSFIAQFDLAEIARFDVENLLPKTGLLSFFYDCDTMRAGYDPKDKNCARVYYFEDVNAVSPAEFPADPGDDFRFPEIGITARSEGSYPCFEDFLVQRGKLLENWEEFEAAQKSLGIEEPNECSKLLGWANVIQGNMTRECELVSRGYYLGNGWNDVSPKDRQEAEQWANRDWLLLFQLDTVFNDSFELMFGDCGRIYFYIRREDLAASNFNNVRPIMQCC